MRIPCVSKRTAVVVILVTGILAGVWQHVGLAQRGNASSPIMGVWRIAEITTTGPNGRTNTKPQPGLYIYTRGYYSVNRVGTDAPRSELPQEPTDKQKAEMFDSYIGHAGTLEVNGNEMTYRQSVHLSPNGMKVGSFNIFTLRFEGNDVVYATAKATANGPVQNPTTYKMIRVE